MLSIGLIMRGREAGIGILSRFANTISADNFALARLLVWAYNHDQIPTETRQ